ncbi:MAG: single-stranded DNA-binding protein [Thermoplasmata archaeon]|nr:single-stranded DNA-binding protein [Thermoplasmata archaeon]
MNQVTIIGRCGSDPDVRAIGTNGTLLAEFNVATSKPPKNKGDQWPTTWHKIKLWNKAAEKAQGRLRKGDLVCVVGEIKTESWEDKDGNKKYKTVIETSWRDNVVVEPKEEASNEGRETSGQDNGAQAGYNDNPNDDNCPF